MKLNEHKLSQALEQRLSGADFPAARQREVLKRIKGENGMKFKHTVALVCVVILTLALAGCALAAALGLFGQFGSRNSGSEQRLMKLDEAAVAMNESISLSAPETAAPAVQPQTLYDQLVARQHGRTFDLTLNQAYCDGNKLYYSYTLTTNALESGGGEGVPTGFDHWDMEEPGKRYSEVWSVDGEETNNAIIAALDAYESAWYARDTFGIGDGASLSDGTPLNILDGDQTFVDERTIQGYQEVELPDGLPQSDTLEIEMNVLYGTSVYHQDAQGVRWAHVAQPENRGILRIPFTVSRTGSTAALGGQARFAAYTVNISLLVSDVDISGKAVIACPEEWARAVNAFDTGIADFILDYQLIADGTALPNQDGGIWIREDDMLEIGLRYDLPQSLEALALRPSYAKAGQAEKEAVELSAQE